MTLIEVVSMNWNFGSIQKMLEPSYYKERQKKSQPRKNSRHLKVLNDSKWLRGSLMLIYDQFGIIQNLQTSPSGPYTPNQFLGWDFFFSFLQQDVSSSLVKEQQNRLFTYYKRWHLHSGCLISKNFFPLLTRSLGSQAGVSKNHFFFTNETVFPLC